MNSFQSGVLRVRGFAAVAYAVLALAISASAQVTTTFQMDGGDWNAAANWDNGVPSEGDTAVIGNGLAAVLNGAATGVSTLTLGDATGTGSLILSNVTFSGSIQTSNVGMVSGTTGTLHQTGGLITNVFMQVGNVAGATGRYKMDGGTNVVNIVGHFGANGGHGILDMNGGQLIIQGGPSKPDVLLGGTAGSYFEAHINGGAFLISGNCDAYVGHKSNVAGDTGTGSVYLSGGTLMRAKNIYLGKAQVFMENATIDTDASNNSIFFSDYNKTNSVEMVGGASLCIASKQIRFGTNTTVRVVLDGTCTTNTVFFKTTGVNAGNTQLSWMNGTLRIARKRGSSQVPSSVVLFSSAKGGFTNEFQQVIWEGGLTGTVTYDTAARKVRIENIVAPRAGTMISVR